MSVNGANAGSLGRFTGRKEFEIEQLLQANYEHRPIQANDLGKVDPSYKLFSLICTETWFRQFIYQGLAANLYIYDKLV